MLEHVVLTARSLDAERIAVVVGHQKEAVKENFKAHSSSDLIWVDQNKRLGTGHAARLALEELATKNSVIVLYGDVPLLGINSLKACIEEADRGHLAVLVAEVSEPAGLGANIERLSRVGLWDHRRKRCQPRTARHSRD